MADKYDKKIILLSGLAGVLTLIYAGTLLFDPETVNARKAAYAWLSPKLADQADSITLSGSEGTVTLSRKNGVWLVSRNNAEYPAKQLRIGDVLRILTAKGQYPIRGTSGASLERFGLTEETGSRILVRGGGSSYPLLDLLIGKADSTGREMYLRRNGENEVRSGEDTLSSYVDGSLTAWLDLRLFPEDLQAGEVQRVTAYAPPAENETAPPALVLARQDGGWTVTGVLNPDAQKAESYVRALLEAEGEDFIDGESLFPSEGSGKILLELGNGRTITVKTGISGAQNRRTAEVEGVPFRYALAEWTATRLFRDAAYFAEK
ncbi:MAG: DUF4340 domain-containing protein [Spirochaetaceae bacterium]|jgi:hypothetical protein|nr:DUF4340 domain-containing protein [Spirochaetaceae bacterium]